MENGFKFKIGDFVETKVEALAFRNDIKLNARDLSGPKRNLVGSPKPMMIIGRVSDECPGGVQYHYEAKPWISDGARLKLDAQPMRYHEIELQAYDAEAWINEFNSIMAEYLASHPEDK